jgi:hypothetical protein
MLKLLTFPGTDDDGNVFVQAIRPEDILTKQASAELHPEVARYVGGLKSSGAYLFVLVNALGAGEYYGANINGDYFEESELNPTDPEEGRGYKSFLSSGVYRHHKNKDITRSMGQVVCAVYNPTMHRIELIIRIDRAKAEAEGHGDLVQSLDGGGNPAVSMGCKVRHDICSICGHKSRTRADYCIHTKNMMGQILPDGKKVFVYNPKPKFFDISFVVIGADRTSYAMAKVASATMTRSSAELAEAIGLREAPSAVNLAKVAGRHKLANILKRLPAMSARLMPALEATERPMGGGLLRRLAGHPMDKVMTTAAASGIVLQPREFQRIILIRMGRSGLASKMDHAGHVFPPTAGVDRSFQIGRPSQYSPEMSGILRHLIPDRGMFSPQITRRIMVIQRNPRPTLIRISLMKTASGAPYPANSEEKALLERISEGYNSYRLQLLEKMGSIVDNVTRRDPKLIAAIDESRLEDAFMGSLMTKQAAPLPVELLAALPLAYLYGAHVRGRRGTGQQVGPIDSFVEKHPVLATSVFLGLSRFGMHLKKTGVLDKLLEGLSARA